MPSTGPIAEPQARSLHRWNLSLATLHALQGLVILAISFAKDPLVTAPVVSSFLRFDTATRTLVPAQRPLFDLPIGPAVAVADAERHPALLRARAPAARRPRPESRHPR
jgi:hypothetical protein